MANDTEINEPTLNPVKPEKPKGHNLKINTIFNAIMMSRTTYLYEKKNEQEIKRIFHRG